MNDIRLKAKGKGRGASRKQSRPGWMPALVLWSKRATLGVLTVVTAGVAYFTGQAILESAKWPLSKVVVKGEYQHINKDELTDMIKPYIAESFIAINLHDIKGRLESEPTIYRAMVEREWPDTLVVSIVEQTPYAKWGKDALLNIEGDVFDKADSFVEADIELPSLKGPEGSSKELLAVYKAIAGKFVAIDVKLTSLYRDEKGAHRGVLDTGMELNIGKDDIAARLDRFVQVYNQQLKQQVGQIAAVDLRYSNGIAVKWNRARPNSGEPQLQPALAER